MCLRLIIPEFSTCFGRIVFSFCSVKMESEATLRRFLEVPALCLSVRLSPRLAPVAPNRRHRGRCPEPPPLPLPPGALEGSSLSQPGGWPLTQRPFAFSPSCAVQNADKGALVRPRAAATALPGSAAPDLYPRQRGASGLSTRQQLLPHLAQLRLGVAAARLWQGPAGLGGSS